MTNYISHKVNPMGEHLTACGALWQKWQAPDVYADGSLGVLPGPGMAPGDADEVLDCRMCRSVHPGLVEAYDQGQAALEALAAERNDRARNEAMRLRGRPPQP